MNMHRPPDAFTRLWGLGYRHLTPIIPPDAPISERSTLFKRVGTKQDSRGKSPGIMGRDGLWRGLDWMHYEADEQDLGRWAAMGAGVGIKCGHDGVVLIDADTLDEGRAGIIREIVEAQLGDLPLRFGRWPKAGFVCRVTEPIPYQRVEFGDEPRERVEVLGAGRQFVAEGVHPGTGLPYRWERPLPPLSDLPAFPAARITELLEALRLALPAASEVVREGGSGLIVNQEVLRGDPALIAKAVRALPNAGERFGARESYRDVGYAIKAALPDDPELGLDLFQEWAARWQDGENDPGIVEADWRRMKPPFRRGAAWLFDQAAKLGSFNPAEQWFEPVDDSLAPLLGENFPKPFESVFPVLGIGDIVRRPTPVWLVGRHIPETSVGFLYSEPGAGKSFLGLDIGLSLAYGRQDWHGDALRTDSESVVVYIASEGSFDLRNRIKAWLQERGETEESARFLLIEQTINFMDHEDVMKLVRTVEQVIRARPCLVVVDTVSRALPGADENLQKDMTRFVAACDRLRDRFACAVLGIHHAGKSGDMRGSTVLRGAGDFVFRLTRKSGASVGELACEKMKGGPDGWEEPYRFGLVQLPDGETSLVPERCDVALGPPIEVTPALTNQILLAMARAWDAGLPWSKHHQGKERFAIRVMCRDFGLGAAAAEELLSVWEASGIIVEATSSAHSKLRGLRVLLDARLSELGVFG